MGRWIDRLHRDSGAPPSATTAKTDESRLLSVLSVGREGGAPDFVPDAAAVESRRQAVLARLLRWGWDAKVAEAAAARIARRSPGDDRRTCFECRGYSPGRCATHRAALLSTSEVGRDLAGLLQRCPGYAAMRNGTGEAAGRPATGPNGVRQYQRGGSS